MAPIGPNNQSIVSTTIYDVTRTSRFHPFAGTYVLILGVGLLTWYVRGIGDAIHGDIQNFLPAFHETPVVTLVFTFLKLAGYLFFGALFIVMVYAPLRNLWLRQVVTGTLEDLSFRVAKHDKILLVKLSGNVVALRATDELKNCLEQCAIEREKLRVTVGAFRRALKVEKLS